MIYLSCEMVLLASFDTVGSKHLKNHVITRSHCALRAMVARGTKKKPLCAHCAGKGHYTSTCPVLAAAALKALAKTTDLKKLETQLRNGQPVRLQKLGKKRRTLKKASGKRGFSEAFKVSSKKDQRSAKPKIRHKKKEKDRKPRAKKQDSSHDGVKSRASQQAYKKLLASQWVWKPGKCPCGGDFAYVPWKTCQLRGHGRLFVRCTDCEGLLVC